MSEIEIIEPTMEEAKPKKKYIKTEEQKARQRAYNKIKYQQDKSQLHYRRAIPKEEKRIYYEVNKDIIIERAKKWNTTKRQEFKEQKEEIKLLRQHLIDLGELPPTDK